MKKIVFTFRFVLLVVGMMLAASCSDDAETAQVRKDIPLTRAELDMVSEINTFSFRLFGEMIAATPNEDMLLSPLSLSEVLGMLGNAASGTTRTELMEAIGFSGFSLEEMNTCYKNLRDGVLDVDRSTQIILANSAWVNEGLAAKEAFTQTLKKAYAAESFTLPFNDRMVEEVNNWCSKQTKGLITDFLGEAPHTDMLLLNALYFKGKWAKKFSKEKTVKKEFYAPDETVQADFMCQKNTARCYSREEENFKVLLLPYGNGAFRMYIALPDEGWTSMSLPAALPMKSGRNGLTTWKPMMST